MDQIEIYPNQLDEAISIMKEVAQWGRNKGFRVWLDEWLTKEKLITPDAQPENFFVGKLNGKSACAFILQGNDPEYWAHAKKNEAVYLHKFCVKREFAGRGMTRILTNTLKKYCIENGIKYIRLDTALDEIAVRKIYLNAGFKIVDILDYPNGRSVALYELMVTKLS